MILVPFSLNLKKPDMINKKLISGIERRRPFLLVPAILLVLILFSFRTANVQESSTSQALFSPESQKKIIELIYANIMYPSEAKMQDMTGRFFVIVKMKKGGTVDLVKVNDTDKSINVPLLSYNEVVIVGYGLKKPAENLAVIGYGPAKKSENKNGSADKRDISNLTNEGIRVAKMLGTVKIPEWEKKDMEFAISFNFDLKYPEEKSGTIKIRDNSFKVDPDVVYIVDGKEATKQQIDTINTSMIETVSVLKGESATKVFGEKGKNGVVVITTKK